MGFRRKPFLSQNSRGKACDNFLSFCVWVHTQGNLAPQWEREHLTQWGDIATFRPDLVFTESREKIDERRAWLVRRDMQADQGINGADKIFKSSADKADNIGSYEWIVVVCKQDICIRSPHKRVADCLKISIDNAKRIIYLFENSC